eukprot:CAMPEP_0169394292 /NCGR_PEP_ID=MMETSP1017-20121227/49923_1 /TAXON_ID=342587 /ORGANISM="Karlodinium micrum, Strain CCMP2283" /LENGTH=181 /DNA_ID=CAMNT_0009497987 /DNA_START=113 /DNA_END=658 /DNA_ORIENTATION=-
MIYNLKNGQQYGYREHVKVLDDDSYEARLGREKHQLKIEAGLAGWTEEAIDEQVALLEQAFQALNNLKAERKSVTENTPDSISRISVTVAAEHMEVVKSEAVKLFSMVKNTTKANNCIIGVVMCTFAIAVVGVGAMGGLLTVGLNGVGSLLMQSLPVSLYGKVHRESCWYTIGFGKRGFMR